MRTVKVLLVTAVLLMGLAVLPSIFAPEMREAPASWSVQAQQVATVEGQVVSISPGTDSFVVKVRRVRNCDLKGLTVTVVWDEDTQWTRGRRSASPSELWVGASVTVTGTMVNGVLYADAVKIGGAAK